MKIAGNLDVESAWARLDAAARRHAPSPDDPRFAVSEPALQKISALATLLRVFAASDDDELWTPRPLDPQRVVRVPWLPTPRLASGPVPEEADLWWGAATPLASRMNHRSFVLEVRQATSCEVTQAAMICSTAELQERAAACGPWVAKAPHSAAGRLRVRGEGPLTPSALRHAATLLELYGCLLFEPWFERRGDFGVSGRIDASQRLTVEAVHDLYVDDSGRFLGITVGGHENPTQGANAIALRAGEALIASGYTGPFGVDLFRVKGTGAEPPLHLSEVNARYTFGHVAHALAKLARAATDLDDTAPITLRIGRGAPPAGVVPLLSPVETEPTSAWLEVPSKGSNAWSGTTE